MKLVIKKSLVLAYSVLFVFSFVLIACGSDKKSADTPTVNLDPKQNQQPNPRYPNNDPGNQFGNNPTTQPSIAAPRLVARSAMPKQLGIQNLGNNTTTGRYELVADVEIIADPNDPNASRYEVAYMIFNEANQYMEDGCARPIAASSNQNQNYRRCKFELPNNYLEDGTYRFHMGVFIPDNNSNRSEAFRGEELVWSFRYTNSNQGSTPQNPNSPIPNVGYPGQNPGLPSQQPGSYNPNQGIPSQQPGYYNPNQGIPNQPGYNPYQQLPNSNNGLLNPGQLLNGILGDQLQGYLNNRR